jgi:hypothetical protein
MRSESAALCPGSENVGLIFRTRSGVILPFEFRTIMGNPFTPRRRLSLLVHRWEESRPTHPQTTHCVHPVPNPLAVVVVVMRLGDKYSTTEYQRDTCFPCCDETTECTRRAEHPMRVPYTVDEETKTRIELEDRSNGLCQTSRFSTCAK